MQKDPKNDPKRSISRRLKISHRHLSKSFHRGAVVRVRDALNTAGNSMASSERPSPEPSPKKEASPAVLGGREFWTCSLSFFSLVFLFPWCFLAVKIPWSFGVFSAYFPGFLRVRKVREILGVFEVFLGIFEKTKEKKDRVLEASNALNHRA